MAKLSDVYGITKPSKRSKIVPDLRGSAGSVEVNIPEESSTPDGKRFVLFIDNATADGLEKERAKRGLRSRSETIRVLLAEALR